MAAPPSVADYGLRETNEPQNDDRSVSRQRIWLAAQLVAYAAGDPQGYPASMRRCGRRRRPSVASYIFWFCPGLADAGCPLLARPAVRHVARKRQERPNSRPCVVAEVSTYATSETQDVRDILAGCPSRDWAGFHVAKAGQLRIPDSPCRLGHFEKTTSDTVAFRSIELGLPAPRSFVERPQSSGSSAGPVPGF